MTMLGISSMVMAIRISSNKATVGVAISGNPSPEAPLTKAANSKAMPTRISVGSKLILNPDSVVQSDTAIKRQALQSEGNGSAACSGLQSPVLQRTPGKITSPGPSTQTALCLFASV